MTPFKESLPAIGSQIKVQLLPTWKNETFIGIFQKTDNGALNVVSESNNVIVIPEDLWEYHFDN